MTRHTPIPPWLALVAFAVLLGVLLVASQCLPPPKPAAVTPTDAPVVTVIVMDPTPRLPASPSPPPHTPTPPERILTTPTSTPVTPTQTATETATPTDTPTPAETRTPIQKGMRSCDDCSPSAL